LLKILRVCPTPPSPAYVRAFRNLHQLKRKSFDEQIVLLRRQNLLLPGGWAAAMESEGFEVFETLYNDWALQARWAFENNKDNIILEPNWEFKILLEQVKKFQPDVIFIYAGAFFWVPRFHRDQLRAVCKKKVIMTGFWGDELQPGHTYEDYFGDLDFVFSSSSVYEKHFRDAGIDVKTIGNPFDNTIVFERPAKKKWDFIFCGTTGYGFPDHVGRYEKLVEIMKRTALRIWTLEPNIKKVAWKETLLNVLIKLPHIVLSFLKALVPDPRVRRAIHLSYLLKMTELDASTIFRSPGHPMANYFKYMKSLKRLFPLRVTGPLLNTTDYYSLLAGSKLVLNLHRDEDADIGNIRCFEVTGIGSCLVTDRGTELSEFFDVENDIVAFNTVEECVTKVKYLLDHPEEIERIAQNGQRTTMARHTVKHRCIAISQTLKELFEKESTASARRRQVLVATYDIEKHPISYDFAFFLQAAEIYRKMSRAESLVVNILRPSDIKNMAGVSKEADAAVGVHAREFRIFHICTQLAELMKTGAVINVKDRSVQPAFEDNESLKVLRYPGPEITHHSAYYRLINENPHMVSGLSASPEARRYVDSWLNTFLNGRKLLCVTLRQYRFDPERNSNMEAWADFLSRVDTSEFAIVVLPDTDQLTEFKDSVLGEYPTFGPACFDVDLRFALYEAAYLNMFVNNGPGAASMLDKRVRYLMFKIVVPSVPHCTEEFLKWNGFEVGKTPKFSTPFQKWVWADDDADTLWQEFSAMDRKIQSTSRRLT
jgi:spore maturation protein CgeB